SQRVHTRICASRTLGQDFFARNTSNSRGQGALNAGCVGLDLPAAEIGAVVGEGNFQVAHARKRNPEQNRCIQPYIVYSRLREGNGCSDILLRSRDMVSARWVLPQIFALPWNPAISFCVTKI